MAKQPNVLSVRLTCDVRQQFSIHDSLRHGMQTRRVDCALLPPQQRRHHADEIVKGFVHAARCDEIGQSRGGERRISARLQDDRAEVGGARLVGFEDAAI